MKININAGITNKSKKIDNGKITIKKTYTGFNHKLDYKVTQKFNFVPKLISDTEEEIVWQLIDGQMVAKPTNEDLKQIAIAMRKIHKSDIKLPKNNLRARAKNYINTIHNKYVHIPTIEENWKTMNKLITKMNNINPVHNDVWWENIIKDKNKKIWLIDWEYATMGDKHFDLAFYIESSILTKEQENIFLDAYNSLDDYNAYIKEWMNEYKMFVNWFILLWNYAQDELLFDVTNVIKRVEELKWLI